MTVLEKYTSITFDPDTHEYQKLDKILELWNADSVQRDHILTDLYIEKAQETFDAAVCQWADRVVEQLEKRGLKPGDMTPRYSAGSKGGVCCVTGALIPEDEYHPFIERYLLFITSSKKMSQRDAGRVSNTVRGMPPGGDRYEAQKQIAAKYGYSRRKGNVFQQMRELTEKMIEECTQPFVELKPAGQILHHYGYYLPVLQVLLRAHDSGLAWQAFDDIQKGGCINALIEYVAFLFNLDSTKALEALEKIKWPKTPDSQTSS